MTAPVLPKDMKRKQILDEFLHYCEQKQIEAVKKHDPLMLCIWIKEARLARRELAELFRAKEKRDEERENILGIINRLKSQGIDASVVERAHYITLAK
ncbi:hypothetical protein R6231_09995 [Bacillus cytotoxicus]|uniref:hypothetical protein n=1 Tax=Bacillus cereus group TaxID=86661 RepID=UPI000B97318B|nr:MULTISPECIES: hypothetical protein [Bacillus cereus group]AWC30868.1 hypothetical protein CG483_015025 [Bacillus cytotoxicus]AWC34930.1 hypothetical protein CG482_014780 [Bacillus cytotoxicus]AWC38927.1 hypothetical protein CG481_014555 [Bacillus cytotoxicus]AWC43004.1 hypothetical protein CG480_015025 [Bacillus cytotoxicus]AWC46911.1 hypothetical protein CG479_013975 [Bacillus cytotoxicus]